MVRKNWLHTKSVTGSRNNKKIVTHCSNTSWSNLQFSNYSSLSIQMSPQNCQIFWSRAKGFLFKPGKMNLRSFASQTGKTKSSGKISGGWVDRITSEMFPRCKTWMFETKTNDFVNKTFFLFVFAHRLAAIKFSFLTEPRRRNILVYCELSKWTDEKQTWSKWKKCWFFKKLLQTN